MNIKLHTLFLLFISSLGACGSSNSGYGTDYYTPSYEENIMTVEQQELQSPTQFLSLEATYSKNIVEKWVIEGNVINTATEAIYKDIEIEFYSNTETMIGSEKITTYEFIKAGGRQYFKEKTKGYKQASSTRRTVVVALN